MPAVRLGPRDGTPAPFIEGVLPLAAAAYVVGMGRVPRPVSRTPSDLSMLLEPHGDLAPERGVLFGVVKIHRCLRTLGLGSRGDHRGSRSIWGYLAFVYYIEIRYRMLRCSVLIGE